MGYARSQQNTIFHAVVAKDGTGDYTTVQSAIDAVPENLKSPWLISRMCCSMGAPSMAVSSLLAPKRRPAPDARMMQAIVEYFTFIRLPRVFYYIPLL